MMRLIRNSNRVLLSLVPCLVLGLPLLGVAVPQFSSSETAEDAPRWEPTSELGLSAFEAQAAAEEGKGEEATEGATDTAAAVAAEEADDAAKKAEKEAKKAEKEAKRAEKRAEKAAKAEKPVRKKAPKQPSLSGLFRKAQRSNVSLPRRTPEAYAAGKDAFDRGNYTKAIQGFSDFIASPEAVNSPLLAPARYFIAKSFQELEQTDEAISLYKQVQEEHAKNSFWSGLAQIELASLGEAPEPAAEPEGGTPEAEPEPEGAGGAEDGAGDEEVAPTEAPVEGAGPAKP